MRSLFHTEECAISLVCRCHCQSETDKRELLEGCLYSLLKSEDRPQTTLDMGAQKIEDKVPCFPLKVIMRIPTFDALHHREYRLLWYGQVFTSLGTWMDHVTRGWLIYELTNSPFQLGLVRGVQAIPFLLLSPIAGSVADRYSRKFQVVAAQLAIGLIFVVTGVLVFLRLIQPWHVYASAFLMACSQVFIQPARAAMVSESVPADKLTNAIGLNAVVFNMARSGGPALAGALISIFSTGMAYSIQGLFFVLATAWTLQMRSGTQCGTVGHGDKESFAHSIVTGWKFSCRREEVRDSLLIVIVVSIFMVPFSTLLPVFARDILAVGARGQGLLLTAMGIGGVCSAILIASIGDRLRRGILMLGGVVIYGVLIVLFSSSSSFPFSLLLMGGIGLCHVSSHALVQTVIQTYSPNEYRGRTMAIFHMNQVLVLVGSMLVGALSVSLGAPWTLTVLVMVGIGCMVLLNILAPKAREIR